MMVLVAFAFLVFGFVGGLITATLVYKDDDWRTHDE